MKTTEHELITSCGHYISLNYPRIEKCFAELTEDEVWQRPNKSSNSIGNLTLHLCGNISQYIISALGGNKDERNRDAEFSAENSCNKTELLQKLKDVSDTAIKIISTLSEEQLTGIYSVQGYEKSGIAILIHVTEHYSYHTGQIVFHTKMLKNIDTGFYKGMDLNKKNK